MRPRIHTFTPSGSSASSTSFAVGYSAGILAGDRLICILGCDGAPTLTWPTGWNQAANDLMAPTGSGSAVVLVAKQRIADGSESGAGTFTVTSSASEAFQAVLLVIRGSKTQVACEAGTPATGASTNANPPSLAPSWSQRATLWIAFAANDTGGADDDDITAHPSNYTG